MLESANLLNALNQLVDALTGLERILTTPIPFSYVLPSIHQALSHSSARRYRVHLWSVAVLYNLLLVWATWIPILQHAHPSTAVPNLVDVRLADHPRDDTACTSLSFPGRS